MMMIEIDHEIPLPQMRTRYPVAEMAVGDSFFVAHDSAQTNNRVRAAVHSNNRALGYSFATRTVTENGVEGIRVWRIS